MFHPANVIKLLSGSELHHRYIDSVIGMRFPASHVGFDPFLSAFFCVHADKSAVVA
jgi:hypothetical protein